MLAYLKKIHEIDAMIENHPFLEAIMSLEDMFYSNKYKIAVIGEFSAGKSTFINALLGEELLYYANNESTGAVTTIQSAPHAYVQVYGKNNALLDEFSLENDENRERLKFYLNIRSERCAENVNIFYPMEGVDRDVIFFDTPGIEEMSRGQLELTKNVLGQANAVLFLIKKEGFTEPALKVITGQHEFLGEMKSEDIFVVMTHIGEVYDDRTTDAAQREVDRLIKDAENTLKQNGIGGIRIYPVDSKEYLWGYNDRLYDEEKQTRDEAVKGKLLSQADYRDRSRFDSFRRELYEFLQKDNRNVNMEKDIRNKMNLLLDAMQEKISGEDNADRMQTESQLEELDRRIEDACRNKRKFYNRIVRNLQDNLSSFEDALKQDKKKEMADKRFLYVINETFRTTSDLNDDKLKRCIGMLLDDMTRIARKTEDRTNKHIGLLLEKVLKKLFDDEFLAIFDRKVDIRLDDAFTKLEITFDDGEEDISVEDKDIRRLEKEKKEIESILSQLEEECAMSRKNLGDEEKRYCRKKSEDDRWYMNGLQEMGNRPKAVQKFKKVKKTRGILFWMKTIAEKIPDGMDTSAQEEWDRRQKSFLEEYETKSAETGEILNRINGMSREIHLYESKIEEKKSRIKSIDREILLQHEFIKEEKERRVVEYIDRKKGEIASYFEMIKGKRMDQLMIQTDNYLYEIRKDLEQRIKIETEKCIGEYKEELYQRNRELYESITVTADTRRKLMNKIICLKEELGDERAV